MYNNFQCQSHHNACPPTTPSNCHLCGLIPAGNISDQANKIQFTETLINLNITHTGDNRPPHGNWDILNTPSSSEISYKSVHITSASDHSQLLFILILHLKTYQMHRKCCTTGNTCWCHGNIALSRDPSNDR